MTNQEILTIAKQNGIYNHGYLTTTYTNKDLCFDFDQIRALASVLSTTLKSTTLKSTMVLKPNHPFST